MDSNAGTSGPAGPHSPGEGGVIVTTGTQLRHRLFLALLLRTLPEPPALVVLQEPAARKSSSAPPPPGGRLVRFSRRVVRGAVRRLRGVSTFGGLLGLIPHPQAEGRRRDEYLQRRFAPIEPADLSELERTCRVLRSSDPNAPDILGAVRESRPRLALIFGGKILRDAWLEAPTRGALNMHFGVLPFYRSSYSITMPLFHDRPDRVGATVHYIDAGVDTGPIVEVTRVDVSDLSSLAEVEGAVYEQGIRTLVRCGDEAARQDDPLESRRLSAPDSYYTSKLDGGYIRIGARATLERLHRDWPASQRALDAAKLRGESTGRSAFRGVPPGLYVLLYHSVVRSDSSEPWENAYSGVRTAATDFDAHLAFLTSTMRPIRLSEAFDTLRRGPLEEPCFAITFDDGYANCLSVAAPICERYGVSPTVFVNSRFASQEDAYYRVILSVLDSDGEGAAIALAFNDTFRTGDFTARNVLRLSKKRYEAGATQAAARLAWQRVRGDAPLPPAHLNFEELSELRERGWEVGNHTLEHATLSRVSDEELVRQLEECQRALEDAALDPIPWLSYPNGRAVDVDERSADWVRRDPNRHGILADGGVNFFPSRTEWLRIPVVGETLGDLRALLAREANATWDAFRQTYPYDHA